MSSGDDVMGRVREAEDHLRAVREREQAARDRIRKADARMREASGVVFDERFLVTFLYVLLRDHLLPGTVEELVEDILTNHGDMAQFTNGWLASYAQDIANRLTPEPEESKTRPVLIETADESGMTRRVRDW